MGLISIINRGDVCKCRLRMEIANFFTRAGQASQAETLEYARSQLILTLFLSQMNSFLSHDCIPIW